MDSALFAIRVILWTGILLMVIAALAAYVYFGNQFVKLSMQTMESTSTGDVASQTFTGLPVPASTGTAPAKVSVSNPSKPATGGGSGASTTVTVPPGFHGPTSAPHVNGPSGPPPGN